MPRKFFVVGADYPSSYINWMECEQVYDMDKCNGVVLEGGSDITPKYYGHPNRYSSNHESYDAYEWEYIQKAIKLGLPIISICKGFQWSAVAAGAFLIQNMRHKFFHQVKTNEGKSLWFNSMHHQNPCLSNLKENEDYKLLAWAENLSPFHYDGYGRNIPMPKEPEAAVFPKINAVGFQNHFEHHYVNKDRKELKESLDWAKGILTNFLNEKL